MLREECVHVFEQVFDFLHRVETMPHKVGVTNLSLNGASEDAQTLRAEMTLTIFADLAENSGSAKSTRPMINLTTPPRTLIDEQIRQSREAR